MRKLFPLIAALIFLTIPSFAQNNARMLGVPNAQTGTSYTFVAQDTARVTTFNNASPVAVTLPNGASQGFGGGTVLTVGNLGAGTVTITCSACTINGVGTFQLTQNQGVDIYGGFGTPAVNYVAIINNTVANAAIKPAASDGIQYISATGITGQDGTSRGSSLPATLAGLNSAQANLPANGGTVVVQGSSQISLATQLALGTTTQHVTLLMERGSSITWTGSGCAISIASGSSLVGPNLIGANTSNLGGASIFLGASATGPLLCNAATDGTQEYFNASGLIFIGNGLTSQSAPLINLTAVFVNSYLRDIVAYNYGGPVLSLQNGTVPAAGFGPFICDNCWLNGSTLAGAKPVVVTAQSGGGDIGNISFLGGAVEHAGTGLNEVTVDGSANHAVLGPVSFYNTYCENSFAASSCFSFKDTYGSLLEGVTCGGTPGTNCASYSGDASQQAGFGSIINLYNISGFTNTVNDTVRPVTIPGSSTSRIAHYIFTDPAATNQQALNVPAVIFSSSGGGTITHQAPNTASNFTITDPAATGNAVVDSATQTETNKTLTSPVINTGASGTGLQGTDTKLMSAGTVTGTSAPLCTDANGGATTSSCPSAAITNQVLNQVALGGATATAVSGNVANGETGQVLQSTNAAAPSFVSPGLPWGNGSAAVTATPYAVACDSGTAVADRGTTILFQSGASVINLPDPTAAGCTGNFAVSLYDDGAGTLTVNRGGTSTINVLDGTTNTDGATSFTLATGQTALCNANAAGTIWACRKLTGGSGVTALCSNVPTTDTLTNSVSTLQTFATSCVVPANYLTQNRILDVEISYSLVTTTGTIPTFLIGGTIGGTAFLSPNAASIAIGTSSTRSYVLHCTIGSTAAPGASVTLNVACSAAVSGSNVAPDIVNTVTAATNGSLTIAWQGTFGGTGSNDTAKILSQRVTPSQ